LIHNNFQDIIHYWVVYDSNSGKLIAYSQNYIYEKFECNYSVIKFDPNYLKLYSSYALIYTMNEYYLGNQKFLYVNDGFKSLLHETNIQNYLIEKFQFKKVYLDINIYLRPYISKLLKITKPLHPIFSRFNAKIKAFIELSKLRKE